MPMLTWETVDPKAIYPFERYSAVSGSHEYRIVYGPEAASEAKPWILTRFTRIGGVPGWDVFHRTYSTDDDAKEGAEHWEGPPPQ